MQASTWLAGREAKEVKESFDGFLQSPSAGGPLCVACAFVEAPSNCTCIRVYAGVRAVLVVNKGVARNVFCLFLSRGHARDWGRGLEQGSWAGPM